MKIFIVRSSYNGMPDTLYAYFDAKLADRRWRELAKKILGDDWHEGMTIDDIMEALNDSRNGYDLEFSEAPVREAY